MRRWLYLSALAVLAALLVLTPAAALAQDQYEEEVVPEILEEQTEDPQEPGNLAIKCATYRGSNGDGKSRL